MKHDRDLTMRDGDRAIPGASLKECFDCHAVKDEQGTPVTYAERRRISAGCATTMRR